MHHFRYLLVLVVIAVLAGCGVVDSILSPPEEEPHVTNETPAAPINSNRFVLQEGEDVVGELQVIYTRYEDSFVDVARTYGLGFDELVQANPGVDPWIPGAGTELVLPTLFVLPEAAREGVVLNIASKRLFYFPPIEEGEPQIVETYPIGIGRTGWATPTGDTTVVSRARDPIWYVPASVRREHEEAGDPLPAQVPPGPDNPLGAYVLALGIPGYLIHGTNRPGGVGMRVSHGCVRMFSEDIEWLYEQVGIGVRVRIVNQPFLVGWAGSDLVLEAHPPLEEDERNWSGSLPDQVNSSLVNSSVVRVSVDQQRLADVARAQRGFPVSVLDDFPDTEASIRRARRVANIITYDMVADANEASDQNPESTPQ